MNKTKKIGLLTLGTVGVVAAVVTPIVVVATLKPSVQSKHYKLLPTYTGQADQLIALGISPDYYPVQLNQTQAYGYLTNPSAYMRIQTEENPDFAKAFENKIHSLFSKVTETGRSWWNMNAEKNDNTNPNKEYWTVRDGDITFYEHYLLDDDKKIIDNEESPSYHAALQTNFRWSQDPYTRISKTNIEKLDSKTEETITAAPFKREEFVIPQDKLYLEFQRILGLKTVEKNGNQWTYKIVPSMWKGTDFVVNKDKWLGDESLFNDAFFALQWHVNFLDNPELASGGTAENFSKFIYPENEKSIFSQNNDDDLKLSQLFQKATLTSELAEAGLGSISYRTGATQRHHPIYDAQTESGEAPMYEGARRENMLYLYNLASELTHSVKGQDSNGKELSDKHLSQQLAKDFTGDYRWSQMNDALSNANKIAGDLDKRLNAIKDYFQTINVAGKTVALTTIAPGGGVSTIQTNSKYSFLFDRTGMNYSIPKKDVWDNINPNQYDPSTSLFSMDDNGWFWDIGTGENELRNAQKFEDTADLQILAVRENEWKGMTDGMKTNLSLIEKGQDDLSNKRVNYDLWNEGLKTPFVLNMILDEYVSRVEKLSTDRDATKRSLALDWGNYWTIDFIK